MKRCLLVLCLIIGCTGPPIHVYTGPDGPVTFTAGPDTSGIVPLRFEGTVEYEFGPGFKVPASAPIHATAVVIRQGDGWALAATCHHCVLPVPDTIAGMPLVKTTIKERRLWVDDRLAEVVAERPDVDLALVRFTPIRRYPVYALGKARLGEPVWVVGWPEVRLWHDKAVVRKYVMRGHVTMLDRLFLGHNAGCRGGFSGGGILSGDGGLLGISQSTDVADYGSGNFSYAVDSEHIRTMLNKSRHVETCPDKSRQVSTSPE